MIFETERCRIRRLDPGDLPGMFALQGNPNVMRHASGDVQTEEECKKEIIDLMAQYEAPNPSLLVWAIEDHEKGFIGTCALIPDADQSCEIGYRILEQFWGRGYASEVANGLVSYCRTQFSHYALKAYCFVDNIASWKVLEKVGFVLQKEFYNEEEGMEDRLYFWEPKN